MSFKGIIKKELSKYKIKRIKILDKDYGLYLIPELCDEDLNLFEGFLFVDAKNKSEFNYFKNRYRTPVSGYAPRIGLIFYNDSLLIKDYRRYAVYQVNKTLIDKVITMIREPTEENFIIKRGC